MILTREEYPIGKRQQLKAYCYDIIGCIQHVHQTLGPAMVEYVYQEALTIALQKKGYEVKREYYHHPVYEDETLETCIKMDIVVFMPEGNVIIECKSIVALTDKERLQTFGYMGGTQFPYAILANFGTYPKAEIERYHQENGIVRAF